MRNRRAGRLHPGKPRGTGLPEPRPLGDPRPAGLACAPVQRIEQRCPFGWRSLSNVRFPAPVLLPRTPAEVNSEALPAGGVGLVIATATGRIPAYAKVALPPPWPGGSRGWLLVSAPAHSPVYEWLWFRIGATTYVADVAIGWKASRVAQQALGPIVHSINPGPAPS